jgi:hypothetical protein
MSTCGALDFTACGPHPTCGNVVVGWASKQCDGGVLGGLLPESCTSLGYSGGTLACNANCSFDVSGCTP